MQETDKKRFAELMGGLAQTFTIELSTRDLENYWQFLRTYSLNELERAIIEYCSSPEGHRFMPKPGEIVALLQGKKSEQALLAWVKVTKAMRQTGAYKTVVFDDAIIHAVIADLGGWVRLCHLSERELAFQQREFERLYACYVQQPVRHYPRQLSGITDSVNAALGYVVQQPPVLLGDMTRAAVVYQNGQETVALPAQSLSIQQILQLAQANTNRLSTSTPRAEPAKDMSATGEPHDD